MNSKLNLARLTDRFSVSPHDPVRIHELPHSRPKAVYSDLDIVYSAAAIKQPTEAVGLQQLPVFLFSLSVSHEAASLFALHDDRPTARSANHRAFVVEVEFRSQFLVTPPSARRVDGQDRAEPGGEFFKTQLLRQLEVRCGWHVEQPVDERGFLTVRNLNRLPRAEQLDPLVRSEIFEWCDGVASNHEASGHDERHVADVTRFLHLFASQTADQSPRLRFFLEDNLHRQFPGRAVVPLERLLVGLTFGVEDYQPAGCADRRQHFTGEVRRKPIPIHCRLKIVRLTKPVGSVDNAAAHQRENAAVVLVFNFLQLAGFQLEWFDFAPRAVGSALSLDDVDDNLPVLATGGQIEMIDNLTIAGGRRRQLAFVKFIADHFELAFPLGERFFNLRCLRAFPLCRRRRDENVAGREVAQEVIVKVERGRILNRQERREVAGPGRAADVTLVVCGQNRRPDVLAQHFLFAGLRARAERGKAAFFARQLRLKFLAVMHDAVDPLVRDVRNLNAFAGDVRLASKADVSAKTRLQNLCKRH